MPELSGGPCGGSDRLIQLYNCGGEHTLPRHFPDIPSAFVMVNCPTVEDSPLFPDIPGALVMVKASNNDRKKYPHHGLGLFTKQ